MGKPLMEITTEAMQALQDIRWTGNIRELKNVVERLAILCEGIISADDVRRFAI
jgi:two-component system, NtrC family, nitrogen regulation response regulator NtrX